jgi:hypothetical protein
MSLQSLSDAAAAQIQSQACSQPHHVKSATNSLQRHQQHQQHHNRKSSYEFDNQSNSHSRASRQKSNIQTNESLNSLSFPPPKYNDEDELKTALMIESPMNTCNYAVEIRRDPIKSRCVYSSCNIPAGAYVLEYKGQWLIESIAHKREQLYSLDPSLGSYMFFARVAAGLKSRVRNLCVDATMMRNAPPKRHKPEPKKQQQQQSKQQQHSQQQPLKQHSVKDEDDEMRPEVEAPIGDRATIDTTYKQDNNLNSQSQFDKDTNSAQKDVETSLHAKEMDDCNDVKKEINAETCTNINHQLQQESTAIPNCESNNAHSQTKTCDAACTSLAVQLSDSELIYGVARYINHSRRNANLIPRLLYDWIGQPHLCFFAIRNIQSKFIIVFLIPIAATLSNFSFVN